MVLPLSGTDLRPKILKIDSNTSGNWMRMCFEMGFPSLPTVSVERFDNRAPVSYQTGIQSALDRLGGLAEFVKPGQKVLLKPDLMFDYPGDCGQISSPEFVAAVGRLVKELGAEVYIGDSPFILRGDVQNFWQRTGMLKIGLRNGFQLVNFEMTGSRAVAVDTRVFYISTAVLDADVVINLPRLKRDSRVGYAGAIRNMLGTIPGFQKGRLYKERPRGRELAGILVDIFSVVRPELTIMESDPEGHPKVSPFYGHSFAVVSADAVAADAVAAEILGFDVDNAYTARLAGDAGLGISWLEAIMLEGVPLREVRAHVRPAYTGKTSRVLHRVARGLMEPHVWLKSSVNGELCNGCGTCVKSCPTNALRIADGSRTPSINHNICIGCWAGLTNCPTQAIYLESSRLVNHLFPA